MVAESDKDSVGRSVTVLLMVISEVNVAVILSNDWVISEVGVWDSDGDAECDKTGETDEVGVDEPRERDNESKVCVGASVSERDPLNDGDMDAIVGVWATETDDVNSNETDLEAKAVLDGVGGGVIVLVCVTLTSTVPDGFDVEYVDIGDVDSVPVDVGEGNFVGVIFLLEVKETSCVELLVSVRDSEFVMLASAESDTVGVKVDVGVGVFTRLWVLGETERETDKDDEALELTLSVKLWVTSSEEERVCVLFDTDMDLSLLELRVRLFVTDTDTVGPDEVPENVRVGVFDKDAERCEAVTDASTDVLTLLDEVPWLPVELRDDDNDLVRE
jgi:hypothetical protein